MLQAPFFLVAHAPDAMDQPVAGRLHARTISTRSASPASVWTIAGLVVVRRAAGRRFSDRVTAATLVALLFGTEPLSLRDVRRVLQPRLLVLPVAALLLLTDAVVAQRSAVRRGPRWRAALLGLVAGLIVLTRHTNACSCCSSRSTGSRAPATAEPRAGLALAARSSRRHARRRARDRCRSCSSITRRPAACSSARTATSASTSSSPRSSGACCSACRRGCSSGRRCCCWRSPACLLLASRDPRGSLFGAAVVMAVNVYIIASWWDWQFGASYGHRGFVDALPAVRPRAGGVLRMVGGAAGAGASSSACVSAAGDRALDLPDAAVLERRHADGRPDVGPVSRRLPALAMTSMRRVALVVIAVALAVAALAYLREPSWLARMDYGFRGWQTEADGTRYRWTGGHASFFVRRRRRPSRFRSGRRSRRGTWQCSSRSRSTTGLSMRSCCESRRGTGERSACRRQAGAGCGESTCGSIPFEKAIAACRSANGKFDDGRRDTEFMTKTMKAIHFDTPGGPDVLRLVDRPAPTPAQGEVLIRVEAAGVNRPDILQRRGGYAPPPGASDILGLEVAGTVVEVGSDEPRWRPGDTVCALVAGGGYAEYCAAPSAQCLPIPAGLRVEAAAAIPETYFTVWTNLFQLAKLTGGRDRPDSRRHRAASVRPPSSSHALRRDGARDGGIRREVRRLRTARRTGHQLPHRRLRREGRRAHRRQRRQRRPRHRRRRLPAAEHRLPGEVRQARPDRPARQRPGADQPGARDEQAADHYRFDCCGRVRSRRRAPSRASSRRGCGRCWRSGTSRRLSTGRCPWRARPKRTGCSRPATSSARCPLPTLIDRGASPLGLPTGFPPPLKLGETSPKRLRR